MLLGDEAIAYGAVNNGISGVYAYPGTPSTEITECIQSMKITSERGIHCRWCTNEKTAMEAALGVSYVGKRAIVCMKHVGLNVCADPFVNSGMTGANGGLIVIVADDPSMHSSQNEQDSRFYGKFAFIPVLEPSSQQEAYDMMSYGFELSEKNGTPVLMRVTTRMAHSRAVVEIDTEARQIGDIHYPANPRQWILLPANSRERYPQLIDSYKKIEDESSQSPYNIYFDGPKKDLAIITSGIAYNYVRENVGPEYEHPVLKISQYPIPRDLIIKIAEECETILVIEEGQPYIEERIKGVLPTRCHVIGKLTAHLPRTGELTPDIVRSVLALKMPEKFQASNVVVPRPPALCQGCGHRDMYAVLNEILEEYPNHKVFGDIGCYTLGALPPFRSINSCVEMGASISMAKGASDAGQFPAVAVIGDSTFTHSGITGLLDAANENANIVVVISDNLTTAMTGGQDSAGTSKIEAICKAVGVNPDHIRVVVPLPSNKDEMEKIVREELNYKGVSVIIPRRECMQTLKRHNKQKSANN